MDREHYAPTRKYQWAVKWYKLQLHVFTWLNLTNNVSPNNLQEKNIQFDTIYTVLKDIQK